MKAFFLASETQASQMDLLKREKTPSTVDATGAFSALLAALTAALSEPMEAEAPCEGASAIVLAPTGAITTAAQEAAPSAALPGGLGTLLGIAYGEDPSPNSGNGSAVLPTSPFKETSAGVNDLNLVLLAKLSEDSAASPGNMVGSKQGGVFESALSPPESACVAQIDAEFVRQTASAAKTGLLLELHQAPPQGGIAAIAAEVPATSALSASSPSPEQGIESLMFSSTAPVALHVVRKLSLLTASTGTPEQASTPTMDEVHAPFGQAWSASQADFPQEQSLKEHLAPVPMKPTAAPTGAAATTPTTTPAEESLDFETSSLEATMQGPRSQEQLLLSAESSSVIVRNLDDATSTSAPKEPLFISDLSTTAAAAGATPTTSRLSEETLVRETPATLSESQTPQAPAQAVVRQVRYMTDKGLQSMSMRLNPPALGELRIEVAMSGADTVVRLFPSCNAARRLLESQAAMLGDSLIEQGVRVTKVEVAMTFNDSAQMNMGASSDGAAKGNSGAPPQTQQTHRSASYTQTSPRQEDAPRSHHDGCLNIMV